MRWVVLAVVAVVFVGCKKKDEPAPEPAAATTPSVGRSVTKLKESEAAGEAPGDAGETAVDAPLYGGNGQPAQRDPDGRIRGPGGPVYMGRGPDCTNEIDHCLREGVWFAVGRLEAGKLYRATPVFEFEGTWYTFRSQEADWQTLLRTKVVEQASELSAGSPVVWLIEESSGKKWLNSEYDALTTSRWEAGVIESVGTSSLKVKGWAGTIPLDTARVVIQQKRS